MLYLRDEFAQHPKFDGWTVLERWALLELMLYLSRYNGDGKLPKDRSFLPRSCTPRVLEKAKHSGWIDVEKDGSERFHKWSSYNYKDAAKAARQARWRKNVDARVDVSVDGAVDVYSVDEPFARARDNQAIEPTTPSSGFYGSNRSDEESPAAALEAKARPAQESEFLCPSCGLECKSEARLEDHLHNVHWADEVEVAP